MNPPLAAARIAWSSWHTPCRKSLTQIPLLIGEGSKTRVAREFARHFFRRSGVTPNMLKTAFLLMTLVPADVSAQQKPTTGYAPVNGVKMYYEVHGSGEPVVLLHGAFMTITNNWTGWIGELSKTRKVIAVELQGHGRTADIDRDISSANLADDVAARCSVRSAIRKKCARSSAFRPCSATTAGSRKEAMLSRNSRPKHSRARL